ncbi:hypothetical protein B0H10DRAFT_2235906 [Mycena sp. CBHHK59/15]|nr:hypothetical protein B0H10DRAFT_2235906 [Mycena sp. CBHHK59/15]
MDWDVVKGLQHCHFVELQSTERNINTALDIWAASVLEFGHTAHLENAAQLYAAIDSVAA